MSLDLTTTIEHLYSGTPVYKNELINLLKCEDPQIIELLRSKANSVRQEIYGTDVYIRGLIEFTNYCKNNCYYCGIRRDNLVATRYRLAPEDILSCCDEGYKLGFRTFVLQGGEDGFFTRDKICHIVASIKDKYPDCALTLSIGEWSRADYQAFYNAGADRYLLRHETACKDHYSKLHPENMCLDTRKECLFNLKDIGFQVGSGFMVGSPFQTLDNLVEDIFFLAQLKPHMIGIGPYITHKDTPFRDKESGSLDMTLKLISILRLSHPKALIPATTALGTIHPNGRELGLKAGANVIMPNLSPASVREKYMLYDNKLSTGKEAAEGLDELKKSVAKAGYKVVIDVGHSKLI
ncbi:MAG: [Lachnospiraceae bacterium]|nr:[FeFe] hydrogenase H-cluster radical SAM maturase HydE [Lachnospiraceae bacterium]